MVRYCGVIVENCISTAISGPTSIRSSWNRRGFTLVELMTTVAIVGVLAAIAVQGVRSYVASAKSSEALEMVGAISNGAVSAFERQRGASEQLAEGQEATGATETSDVTVNGATVHRSGVAYLCGSADPVPASITSVKGRKYQPNSAPGSDYETGDSEGGWKCVMFSNSNPQSYQLEYSSSASASSLITTRNDYLNGDYGDDPTGTPSPYEMGPDGLVPAAYLTAMSEVDLDGAEGDEGIVPATFVVRRTPDGRRIDDGDNVLFVGNGNGPGTTGNGNTKGDHNDDGHPDNGKGNGKTTSSSASSSSSSSGGSTSSSSASSASGGSTTSSAASGGSTSASSASGSTTSGSSSGGSTSNGAGGASSVPSTSSSSGSGSGSSSSGSGGGSSTGGGGGTNTGPASKKGVWTVTARGDTDGDGILSLFVVTGTVNNGYMIRGTSVTQTLPDE